MNALVLLLVLSVCGDIGTEVAGLLDSADPARGAEILAELADRLETVPARERKTVLPLLLGIVADDDRRELHAPAMAPLVATGTPAGIRAALVELYGREDTPLRAAARAALESRGKDDATRFLVGQLGRDRSPRARALVALTLGARARAGWPAETGSALVKALDDSQPMVRAAAAEALTRAYGICRGYDSRAWEEAAKSPPSIRRPRDRSAPQEGGAPGEVVTRPGEEDMREPATEVEKLVPRFYGIPLDRSAVIVVLDISRSVRGPGGDRVRSALLTSLSLLPTIRPFTVLAFDERLLIFDTSPVPARPGAKERLAEFLNGLPPGQRTEILMPIRTAVAMAKEHGGAQVLIISDGAPTVAGPPLDDLVERARGLPEAGVRVDAAVVGGRSVGLFRFLTRLTGGSYVALPRPK